MVTMVVSVVAAAAVMAMAMARWLINGDGGAVWARGSRDFVVMGLCRPIYQTLVAGAS
jgi:hypothetical protein